MYTDDDFATMVREIARFVDESMDQFDNFQFESKFGPTFISISRKPRSGATANSYRRIEVVGN